MNIVATVGAAAILALAAQAQTIVPSQVVVSRGDTVQDAAGGAYTVNAVGAPHVNASGQMTVLCDVMPQDGSSGQVKALLTNRSGQLRLIARAGGEIDPAANPGLTWATLSGMFHFISDNGRVVAVSLTSPALPLDASGRRGVFASDTDGLWTIKAATGTPLPGNPGVPIVPVSPTTRCRVDDGQVSFPALAGNTWYNIVESGNQLFVRDQLAPNVALQGNPANAYITTGSDFGFTANIAPGTVQFVRGTLAGAGPGPMVLTGQVVPLLNLPGSWSLRPNHEANLSANGNGELVFSGTVKDALTPGALEKAALLKMTPAGFVLLARQGDAAPGIPGATWSGVGAGAYALSDTGETLWQNTVTGSGITTANDGVLVRFSAGASPTASLIAREGSPAAGVLGYTYLDGFQPSFTRRGDALFNASIKFAGTGGSTLQAFYVADHSGVPRPFIVTLLSSITLPGQGTVVVSNISGLARTGGNDGNIRVVTEDGRVAVSVTHPAGDAAVLINIPCAADVGATGGTPGYDGALDNNDFVAFIDLFFNNDPRADRGRTGGLPGGDGLFDNNDFVVFIDEFFAGCA